MPRVEQNKHFQMIEEKVQALNQEQPILLVTEDPYRHKSRKQDKLERFELLNDERIAYPLTPLVNIFQPYESVPRNCGFK